MQICMHSCIYVCLVRQAGIKGGRSAKPEMVDIAEAPREAKADDVILILRVNGPTAEKRPRIEICAKTVGNPRMFICTLFPKSCPNHKSLVEAMQAKVALGMATKLVLLRLKAEHS